MSVDTFKPTLWAPELVVPYEDALIYGDPTIANTRFQPMLQKGARSIEINRIGAGTTRPYDSTVDITYDKVNTTKTTLTMDQEDYWGFEVDDVDKVQAAGDFKTEAIRQHGIAMANTQDSYLANLLKDGAGKKLGNIPVFNGDQFMRPAAGQTTAWDIVRRIATELNKVSAPSLNRWFIVDADFGSALIADPHLTEADKAGTDEVARNGQIAAIKSLGLTVKVSNNAPTVAGRGVGIAGVHGALDFASQLQEMEAMRSERGFKDLVRGLYVYGGSITRPEGLVTVETDVQAGAAIYGDPVAP